MKQGDPTILVIDDDPKDLILVEAAFTEISVTVRSQFVTSRRQAVAYRATEGSYTDRGLYIYPNFVITELRTPGIEPRASIETLYNYLLECDRAGIDCSDLTLETDGRFSFGAQYSPKTSHYLERSAIEEELGAEIFA